MNVHVLPSGEVALAAAQALIVRFAVLREKEFLFLSSGGSSLALLEHLDAGPFGPHSTIGVLDERYSSDPSINNTAQLAATDFVIRARERGAHCIDTTVHPGETIEQLAERFELALREWMERTQGVIIASVGVGSDAHTSGVMPYPEDPAFFEETFNDDARWVVAYDAGNKNPLRQRITTTLPFLRRIQHPILFVVGESKRSAIAAMLAAEGVLNEHPCRIWREVPSAELYTDQVV